jgi:hypothetical protein
MAGGLLPNLDFVAGLTAEIRKPERHHIFIRKALVALLFLIGFLLIRVTSGTFFINTVQPEKVKPAHPKRLESSSPPPTAMTQGIPSIPSKATPGNNKTPGNEGLVVDKATDNGAPVAHSDNGTLERPIDKSSIEIVGRANAGETFTVPGDAEGVRFIANMTGTYRFTIVSGAYSNYTEEDQGNFGRLNMRFIKTALFSGVMPHYLASGIF